MTLGSLFSGAGGFEYAGTLAGFTPIWASEIEPFAIRVTTKRFPEMAHLGDVKDIRGDRITPVDVITFGSPCQDISTAGRRAGLAGERSGLFYEAIRVIKEMRRATDGEYPKFIVWENVPGAYSSNEGEDFRTVLEEIAKIKDERASVPKPDGRWERAGEIMGEGFSIAWRTMDAQYWGVPQRRKRIFLVADFGGGRAAKILFERDRLRGDSETGEGSDNPETVIQPYSIGNGQVNDLRLDGKARTLNCMHDAQAIIDPRNYIARRLTPLECCRLQGFPDWWIADIKTEEPTEEEITEWVGYFETFRKATDPRKKPKTRSQIKKWLNDPQTDSAEYKMWGNSLAIPCAYHVLAGIAEQIREETA